MEPYTCKFCYEDFENRDDVITPCVCNGSNKYVCKECLNKYISLNKTDTKYNECSICKQAYKRNIPDIKDSVNDKVRDEVCFNTGILVFLTVTFLLLGKFQSIFIFCMLIIYLITALKIAPNCQNYPSFWAFVFIAYLVILFSPHRYAYVGYAMWIIAMCGYFGYTFLTSGWECIFNEKYTSNVEKLNCLIFDFDLGKFVGGVL